MYLEVVSSAFFSLFFRPSFLLWFGVGLLSLSLYLLFVVGLLLYSFVSIRRGVDILAMRYVRNELMSYQEQRHCLTLFLYSFLLGLSCFLFGLFLPDMMLWLWLSPYYLGYFVILLSVLFYSVGGSSVREVCSLDSGWLLLSLPLFVAIVLLSQFWGTTPFVWVSVLYYHVFRLPLRVSLGYGVASVIAYYTFYILYGIIFLGLGFVGFDPVLGLVLLFTALFLLLTLRFMMLPFRVTILSLFCFYLGVVYLLWM